MQIKTKEFKEVATDILFAVDKNAANLELVVKDGSLRLNVAGADKDYFVSKIFQLEQPEEFRAVVNAQLFLNLISGITADVFDLSIENNYVKIKVGKSHYKAAMVYDEHDGKPVEISPIFVKNVTVNMPISADILQSIIAVNSKEVQKAKTIDSPELNKLYYITDDGCFTFTTSACLNSFKLAKPIKLVLNDRIVKLFKLFKEDPTLFYGMDATADGQCQTKLILSTQDTYLAAVVNCDDMLINSLQRPCEATKKYISEGYQNHIVVAVPELTAALSRLLQFIKNSAVEQSTKNIPATVTITPDELSITDISGNIESVSIANESVLNEPYSMRINLIDLKLVLDSCKSEYITINCGNNHHITVVRGTISNLIPESAH